MKGKDITGMRFGRLTALYFSHVTKEYIYFWTFQCDCGKILVMAKSPVMRGISKSCGCWSRFKKGETKGEDHPLWKGSDVSYGALHTWVARNKGKAALCVDCGSSRKVEWANISQKYKRELADWKSLCKICHVRFDRVAKLSQEEVDFVREKTKLGEKQTVLAKQLGVHQSTISNLLNGKIKTYG